jgi:hypothetical protein
MKQETAEQKKTPLVAVGIVVDSGEDMDAVGGDRETKTMLQMMML